MSKFLSDLSRHAGASRRRSAADQAPSRPGKPAGSAKPGADGVDHVQSGPLQPEAVGQDLVILHKYLCSLGLFDEEFYRLTYPDVVASNRDPFEHFFLHGY